MAGRIENPMLMMQEAIKLIANKDTKGFRAFMDVNPDVDFDKKVPIVLPGHVIASSVTLQQYAERTGAIGIETRMKLPELFDLISDAAALEGKSGQGVALGKISDFLDNNPKLDLTQRLNRVLFTEEGVVSTEDGGFVGKDGKPVAEDKIMRMDLTAYGYASAIGLSFLSPKLREMCGEEQPLRVGEKRPKYHATETHGRLNPGMTIISESHRTGTER